MLNTIGASMTSARQLVAAVENLGHKPPEVLSHIVAGFDAISDHSAPPDPAKAIVEAAAAGELTSEKIDKHCDEAAFSHAANEYRAQLRARCDGLFTERFFKALCEGAADEILDLMRPDFDKATKQLADASSVVDVNTPAAQLAENATAEQLEAFRSIKPAIAKLDAIAAIARRFGPRSVDWAVLDLPQGVDPRGLVDDALMCSSDDLMQAGAVFRGRNADVRSTPWLRISPRLTSVAESAERLRTWASKAFDATVSNTGRGRFEEGKFVPEPIRNPFAVAE